MDWPFSNGLFGFQQSQGIAQHQQRAETHAERGDPRGNVTKYGQRNGNQIVCARPSQVLADDLMGAACLFHHHGQNVQIIIE